MSDTPDDAVETASDENADEGTGLDPFEDLDDIEASESVPRDLFEEVAVPDLDDEAVWEAITEDVDIVHAAAPDRAPDDDDEAVVSKAQFCQKCEHFSDPPEVACSNSGTEIVELVGVDRFKVRNCPVVENRARAETVLPDRTD
jgi:hypothetical protein